MPNFQGHGFNWNRRRPWLTMDEILEGFVGRFCNSSRVFAP
jgi:hypothetical protein